MVVNKVVDTAVPGVRVGKPRLYYSSTRVHVLGTGVGFSLRRRGFGVAIAYSIVPLLSTMPHDAMCSPTDMHAI